MADKKRKARSKKYNFICEDCGDKTKRAKVHVDNVNKRLCFNCQDENYSQCDECGQYLSNELGLNHTQRDIEVCQDCVDDSYISCNDCNEYVHINDFFMTISNNYICEGCRDQNYFICHHCEGLADIDYQYSNEDVTVCEDCRDRYYSYCENCEEMIHINSMIGDYCNECNESESCDCDECSRSGIIHHYGYKPQLNFYKAPQEKKDSLYLGIELEIESRRGSCKEQADTLIGLKENKDERLFFLGYDGTIDNGFEIITHPATVRFHLFFFPWDFICKKMVDMGARSHNTNTCGLHIHVNKDYFTQSELIKIGLFVHSLEQPLSFLSRRKRFNWGKFKDLTKGKKETHHNRDRYEDVNFQNSRTNIKP